MGKNRQRIKYRNTFNLIVINIIIYIISLTGLLTPYALGINANAILVGHQWYRLITNIFSHFGFMHLLCNMYALFSLGMFMENIVGSKKFIRFYLSSGILGSIIVLVVSKLFGLNIIAAGASGAIFSIMGYMLYASNQLVGLKRDIIKSIVITLVLSSLAGGSLMCHISGFVAGLIMAPIIVGKRLR